MILTGQYDSPFVRRVAISLRALGFAYEHDTRSVFGDFDAMQAINPLGRIPSLTLDSGVVLIDSAAILDWLDEAIGPERALVPLSGEARRSTLQRIALACGAIEKIGAANYERLIRPSALRWPDWVARCLTQFTGAMRALDQMKWPDTGRLDQAQITTGCLIGYVKLTDPAQMQGKLYPALEQLWLRLSNRPEFRATDSSDYKVPHGA